MRYLLLILTLSANLCFCQGLAPTANDSLYRAIEIYPDSVELRQSLIHSLLFRSPEEALESIKEGIIVAKKADNLEALADIHSKLGIWHDVHGGSSDSVFHYFNLARTEFLKIGNRVGFADASNNLGFAYSRRSLYKQALPLYQKALEIYDSLKLLDKSASANMNIGIIYQSNNEIDKALAKYKEALEHYGSGQINRLNYKPLSNIATIYNRQEKYDSAIEIYSKLIVFADSTQDFRGLAIFHNNLATSFMEKGYFEKALATSESSLEYKRTLKDTVGMVASLNTTATIYQKTGDHRNAVLLANQGLELNRKVRIPGDQLELLKILAESNLEIGQHQKSAKYFRQYVVLKDSLDREQKQKEISEIMEKYETAQREKEISELELKNQQTELENQTSANQRNLLLLISIVLVVISILLFILFRTRTKSNAIISKSLSEKETLLKEIHHRVKNNLQVVSSLLSMQSRFIKDKEALGAVNEGQARVESMALIHQKLYQETNLSGVKAKEYIEDLAETLRQSYATDTEIEFDFEVDDLTIDVDTIIPIGLILNELICNSLKHAFPEESEGKISILLKKLEDELKLQVSDNGVGDSSSPNSKNSFGKILIDSLAAKLKATLTIDSTVGTSTILNIKKYKLV